MGEGVIVYDIGEMGFKEKQLKDLKKLEIRF